MNRDQQAISDYVSVHKAARLEHHFQDSTMFRRYTKSWFRCAEESDLPSYRHTVGEVPLKRG